MKSLGFCHSSALSASLLGNLTPDRKFPKGVHCWRESKSVVLVLVSFAYWVLRINQCPFGWGYGLIMALWWVWSAWSACLVMWIRSLLIEYNPAHPVSRVNFFHFFDKLSIIHADI
jgi:hypothetical protein